MRLARIPVLNESLTAQQRKLIAYLQMIGASQNLKDWQGFVHDVRGIVDPKFGEGKKGIADGKPGDTYNANLYGRKVKITILEGLFSEEGEKRKASGAAAQWVSVSQILGALGIKGSEVSRLLKDYGVRDRKYSLGKLEDAAEEAEVNPEKAKEELQQSGESSEDTPAEEPKSEAPKVEPPKDDEQYEMAGEDKKEWRIRNIKKLATQVLNAVDQPTDENIEEFLSKGGRPEYLERNGIDPDEIKAVAHILAKRQSKIVDAPKESNAPGDSGDSESHDDFINKQIKQ